MEKIKILYIDDEIINLELFAYHFSDKYEVIRASSGSEGLNYLDSIKDIKAVVSDMRMPEMNGIEFITKAKEMYPSIRFFILTGYDITKEIREALDENLILDYFRKPFNISEIQNAIDSYILASKL